MIVIKRILMFLSLLSVSLILAQKEVLDQYPVGQHFYAGGINEFNKEMVRLVKEQKLTPCENSGEKYNLQILVYENSTISYVKDFDTLAIQKNKCAFDLSRKIIPHLKRWMPAKEDGKFISAITKIEINPFYLFNSKEDPSKNETKKPVFSKGIENFGYQVRNIFERKIKKNEDKKVFLTFVVNENGDMEDFKIDGNYTDNEKKDIINELSRIKGKWKPATFNGIPFKNRLRQPITQNFDIQTEVEDRTKAMYQNMYNNRYR